MAVTKGDEAMLQSMQKNICKFWKALLSNCSAGEDKLVQLSSPSSFLILNNKFGIVGHWS